LSGDVITGFGLVKGYEVAEFVVELNAKFKLGAASDAIYVGGVVVLYISLLKYVANTGYVAETFAVIFAVFEALAALATAVDNAVCNAAVDAGGVTAVVDIY